MDINHIHNMINNVFPINGGFDQGAPHPQQHQPQPQPAPFFGS